MSEILPRQSSRNIINMLYLASGFILGMLMGMAIASLTLLSSWQTSASSLNVSSLTVKKADPSSPDFTARWWSDVGTYPPAALWLRDIYLGKRSWNL